MKLKFIMSIDCGTTSERCMIFDHQLNIKAVSQREFRQIYPKAGWVEQDPGDIWETLLYVCRDALTKAGIRAADIASIGIANQRETTIVWDRYTGKPVMNAIVWQCRRTASEAEKLKTGGYSEKIKLKTGLIPDAYFSSTKLKWILESDEKIRKSAKNGDLIFGTVDSWVIWKLTGCKVHATDYTNASRTMLFNIQEFKWDEDLLRTFGIPKSMMPAVLPSSGYFGETDESVFGKPIPIMGAAGDQQAALFGQCCHQPGQVKNTYGTGGFLLMNTGNRPVFSSGGLLTTISCGTGGEPGYALEGSVFVAGAAIQWLRDELGIIQSAAQSEELALSVEDTSGCYFVPAFTGLGAPYWDQSARGAILGLTRGVGRGHIVRAALEAIAFQTEDILEVMRKDSGINVSRLAIDGGAAQNNFLAEFQSNISDVEIIRPACVETTALGAAFLAGTGCGFWKGLDEIKDYYKVDRTFSPSMSISERSRLLSGWHDAVKRVLCD